MAGAHKAVLGKLAHGASNDPFEIEADHIAGQVMRPGPVALVLPTHVFDALSSVGFRDFANVRKIVILRGTERIKFNYNDVLHGKHLDQNILLQPGDTIYVP